MYVIVLIISFYVDKVLFAFKRYKFHRILWVFLQHILSKLTNGKDFIIVGYSFGSFIAIEVTRKLEAMNFKGQLVLIDGTPELLQTSFFEEFKESDFDDTRFQVYLLINILENYSAGSSQKVCATFVLNLH